MTKRLLVFDSGIGGVTVLCPIVERLPGAEIVYVIDDAGFPYGDWEGEALKARIVGLFSDLIAHYRPDAVVIACNTASTLVLPDLRARHDISFVGTVPAIKPAAKHTKSGLVTVLATPGTVQRDYTFDLIARFAPDVAITLVGSRRLAGLAEARFFGGPLDEEAVKAEIAPVFVEKEGRRTDTVVLACTHYPLLLDVFQRLAPWPVTWINPADAIARRAVAVLGEGGDVDKEKAAARAGTIVFISGKTPPFTYDTFLQRVRKALSRG